MRSSLLDRVVSAEGVLLKVDGGGVGADDADAQTFCFFHLTFDVGRVAVSSKPGPGGPSLHAQQLEIAEPTESSLRSLTEEEPWWRVLGSPLAGISHFENEAGEVEARLQFRVTTDNPRFVRMRPVGDRVRAILEDPSSSEPS